MGNRFILSDKDSNASPFNPKLDSYVTGETANPIQLSSCSRPIGNGLNLVSTGFLLKWWTATRREKG